MNLGEYSALGVFGSSAPTIVSVDVPASATYAAGESLVFTLNFYGATTVTGSPRIALNIGGTVRYADYESGSGTTALLFRHIVLDGDNDANGISVTALELNGGTLQDAAGNGVNLVLNGVGDTSGIIVNTAPPTADIILAVGAITKTENSISTTLSHTSDVLAEFDKYQYRVNGGTWIDTPANVFIGSLNSGTTYSVVFRAVDSNGVELDSIIQSITTSVAILEPVLINSLPDINVNQGKYINVDLDDYFFNADSYQVTGITTGSGLVFDFRRISGTVNFVDVGNSPFTLTVNAINTFGNVSDTFDVEVTASSVVLPQGNWFIGPVNVGVNTVGLAPVYNGTDATSFEMTLDGTNWTTFCDSLFLTGLDSGTAYPNAAVRAVNNVGNGVAVSFAFATKVSPTVTRVDNRVRKILSNARLTLADPNEERWDDATLVAILEEAQIDFCQQTQMLHERINVPVFANDPYFELPANCWQLTRVLYDNNVIPLVTHHELDTIGAADVVSVAKLTTTSNNWEEDKGAPAAVVYDRANMLEGKVYPIPDDRFRSDQSVGYIGITASVEGAELPNLYGIVSDIEDSNGVDINETALFGVVSNLSSEQIKSYLKCYFLKNPDTLENVDSKLSIPSMYDTALKFYVCGQAFMNDIDTGYQQKGADQMRIYERHIKTAKRDSAKDFTRASQFETPYRRGV